MVLSLINETTIAADIDSINKTLSESNDAFLQLCYSLAARGVDAPAYNKTLKKCISTEVVPSKQKIMNMQMNALFFVGKPNALIFASLVLFSYFNISEKDLFLSTVRANLPHVYDKIALNNDFIYTDIDGLIDSMTGMWVF